MMTRYAIDTWTAPTQPGAFQKVRKPSCYHRQGTSYVNQLPSFVKLDQVIGHARAKKKDAKPAPPPAPVDDEEVMF